LCGSWQNRRNMSWRRQESQPLGNRHYIVLRRFKTAANSLQNRRKIHFFL
jgi:hypothetical protein